MERDRDRDLPNFDFNPDFSFSISDVESAPSQDDRPGMTAQRSLMNTRI